MSKYFKNFKNIKKAENAKSLSYFCTNENSSFDFKIYKEFKNILSNSESRFRISLHINPSIDLHNMIIGLKKGEIVNPHKHKKSESYHIIKGKMLLIYFNKYGEKTKEIKLNKKHSLIARVDKNQYHMIVALEDTIYHETRIGPFDPKSDSKELKSFKYENTYEKS